MDSSPQQSEAEETTSGGAVPIPIRLRTHECDQLDEFHDRLIEHHRDLGLDDEADKLEGLSITIEERDEYAAAYTGYATADEWRTLLSRMSSLHADGHRPRWFRAKIAQRLYERIEGVDA